MKYKKKLSTTQLAKCWINSKLDPNKIQIDVEELQEFTEQPLSDEELADISNRVNNELAKYKEKFEEYVKNYCVEA